MADFHKTAMLLLLLAFLAFQQQRLGWFVVALLLSLAVKESIALTMFVFVIYAVIRRWHWLWIAIRLCSAWYHSGCLLRW